MNKKLRFLLPVFAVLAILLVLWLFPGKEVRHTHSAKVDDVPAFSGKPYVVINDNVPEFEEKEIKNKSYESYAPLDDLGRCGTAVACIGTDLMPTEERGAIGQIKPSGWQTVKYEFLDGKYLYNRCHLIGFQLTGENANACNLITGTRYMNVEGMLPFENMVADYIKETRNHVLYRVTPIYDGDNLVARGVQMEALSVEDDGEGIAFNVYVYNHQPGVIIDYATGMSQLEEAEQQGQEQRYVLNKNSKKFHREDCKNISAIKETNRETYEGTRQNLIDRGFSPCGECNP